MLVRRTFGWFAALVVCAGCGAAAAAWHWYGRADGLVKAAVLTELGKICPNGEIVVRAARFDWDETVTVSGLTVSPAAGAAAGSAVAEVPELRITLDRDRFREADAVEVKSLTLIRPTLTLTRRADGSWDPVALFPLELPDPAPAAPRWDVRDATVRLAFHTTADDPAPLTATLSGVNLTLLPSSRRAYRVRGTAAVAGDSGDAGAVRVEGNLDLDRGAWDLAGKVRGLTLGGGLLADAFARDRALQTTLLAAREKWRGVERKLAGDRGRPGGPVRVAALDDGTPVAAGAVAPGPARLTDFGLDGDLAAEFTLSAGSFAEAPAYDAVVTCAGGTLTNRFLPFPLSNVSGTARLRDGELILEDARGRHGETLARARGTFRPAPGGVAGRVEASATRVPITRDMRPRLPEVLRKLHVLLDPTGLAEVRRAVLETAVTSENGVTKPRWELTELDVEVERGTARPEKFRYPVRDVTGTAKTDAGGVLRLDFAGTAGGRPGRFTGWVRNPGKRCEFFGEVAAAGVPLDRTLRDACPPPVAEALEHVALSGEGDPRLTLYRPAGLDSPIRWKLSGPVRNGRVRPASFPYAVENVSGMVRFDSAEDVWHFEDLRGGHGPATLAGSGALTASANPPRLDLSLAAAGVPLDQDLRAALPAGPAAVWDRLRPTGTAAVRAELGWSPGSPVWVAAPEFSVRDATLHLTAFPLPLRDVKVRGSYQPGPEAGGGAATIAGFSAVSRERTPAGPVDLTTTGGGLAEHRADGSWRVRLEGVNTDGLVFGPALRAALPTDLRDALDALALRGPVNLRVRQLEMRGLSDDPAATTAAWDVAADLTRNTASLGPDVTFAGGRVTCGGRYDGRTTDLSGELRSPRADLMGHTLTDVNGPFRLRGDRLVVGHPPDRRGNRGGARLTADGYGGVVQFDAAANLARGPSYELWADLNGLSLQDYADRHLGGSDSLRGSVKSTLNLAGRGSNLGTVVGTGSVDVEPAALGELSVVMRLFKALNRRDSTMFDYAGAQFRVKDETVDFRRIDLVGQAISFRGRGWVDRRGKLGLNFYSRPPARWQLPIISQLSTGWVQLKVDGEVSNPRIDTFSPALDTPLKAFLGPLLIDGGPTRTARGR